MRFPGVSALRSAVMEDLEAAGVRVTPAEGDREGLPVDFVGSNFSYGTDGEIKASMQKYIKGITPIILHRGRASDATLSATASRRNSSIPDFVIPALFKLAGAINDQNVPSAGAETNFTLMCESPAWLKGTIRKLKTFCCDDFCLLARGLKNWFSSWPRNLSVR